MINRKNIIVIAIMAIMLMGSVVLSALTFHVNVYVNAEPDESYFKRGVIGGSMYPTGSLHHGNNNRNFDANHVNYCYEAMAKKYAPLPDYDFKQGVLSYPETNNIYLDINGNEIYDPYQPEPK